MLKGYIEIGEHQTLCHQRNKLSYMGVGIDIVQAHPSAQRSKVARQICNMRTVVSFNCVFDVNAICRSVLTDYQQLFYARLDELFRFAHDRKSGARR